MRAPRRRPVLGGTAALTLGVVVGLRVGRRHAAVQRTAADLRSPALYVPGSLTSDRTLRLVRAATRRAPAPPLAEGVTTTDRTIDGGDGRDLRLVCYEPADRPRPSGALLWIHGGGMVLGTPEQGNELASRVARELGVLVVSVDYRLAPEDPFPCGLDDCATALSWLHGAADELGVDPSRVAVGGDSAGGGLAAALAQRAHDEGGPALAFQLLVYPMLDDRTALRTDHGERGTFVWTAPSNRYAWTAYLGHRPGTAAERPYAAPGRRVDLTGLPPAWIGVGDLDLFHDEDVDYAHRLRAAGVACELHVATAMYHAADSVLSRAPTCRAFRDDAVAALGAVIGARADAPARRG